MHNPEARTTSYAYDANSNITKITYPNSAFVEYTYNAQNWPLSMSDGASREDYQYDYLGQLIKTSYSDGSSTEFAYDAAGRLQTQLT